jgi:hypothetical protein
MLNPGTIAQVKTGYRVNRLSVYQFATQIVRSTP